MIISKSWLNEWVDLKNISGETLLKALNSIGLEVDSYKEIKIPDSIVVGYVINKEKHPDADKLNVCQVDVGGEILQIVCGAKNVTAGQFVPVALIGTVMPNGLEIKKAKLRGIESCGMICSSTELGMVKINDGIMVLDESIGALKLGASLNQFEIFKDAIIEVDITANRGDCQSINGIAREICAALDLSPRENLPYEDGENLLGIGRVVATRADEGQKSSFLYRAFEIKGDINENLLTRLRLALIESKKTNVVERLLDYVTHCTGVLFKAYDYAKLGGVDERVVFDIKNGKHGESYVSCNGKNLGITGIYQDECSMLDENSKFVIIEANYSVPSVLAETIGENKNLPKGDHVYRSTRGSEPNLAYGADYLFKRLSSHKNLSLFAGSQQSTMREEQVTLSISLNELKNMIGQEIARNDIVKILKKLGFEVSVNVEQESINVKVPFFRHDILNSHDICEEIVRIVGIDNITSVPLVFAEQNRLTNTYINYKNSLNLRKRAADCGFFESIHYVFDDADRLAKLGFEPCKVQIANPINNELNMLRPTLLNHMLNSCERNIKNSKKSVRLFELGEVFNKDGVQSSNIAFVVCGFAKEATLINGAKGEEISFYSFAAMVQDVVGKFELIASDEKKFLSPYEQAKICQNGEVIGYIGRVDIRVEDSRDLPKTYFCEIEFDKLKFVSIKANAYSKFPSVSRDLSLVVPDGFEFAKIYECIKNLELKELKEFLPVDIYRGTGLENASSISIKFTFQDMQKTLEDEEINALMDKILVSLKEKLNIGIR
ncbi:phenylalanine--tRNA ligase subunit beta [Campylobacter sp. RM13119]|uniref:phenylalanine--tRNA ligase subunit beta n=1 Tax=Campylobacter californiensis TaxID=1032243 RepID=UPI001473190F|nr:phenylalanine--tRNA ligase subunit beta [Campylobacter sp. RM13119]MBE3605747.1 phenylalanine--tRNA ligase subunit beta [Campylobacter sp. RM13119]